MWHRYRLTRSCSTLSSDSLRSIRENESRAYFTARHASRIRWECRCVLESHRQETHGRCQRPRHGVPRQTAQNVAGNSGSRVCGDTLLVERVVEKDDTGVFEQREDRKFQRTERSDGQVASSVGRRGVVVSDLRLLKELPHPVRAADTGASGVDAEPEVKDDDQDDRGVQLASARWRSQS